MNLSMQIETLHVDKVVINTDNIGGLKAAQLKITLNASISLVILIANSVLADRSLTIPDHFTSYFLLSDIVITYFNSFLMLGLTITFVDPTAELYSSGIVEEHLLQL
jgi:hypothetical protein